MMRRFSKLLSLSLCSILAVTTVLCVQGATQNGLGSTTTAVKENSPSAESELKIGPGDLLEVRVYGAPELSGSLRVSGLGDISMPLIGSVKIAGLTAEQAQSQVQQRFLSGGFLRDPQVNILIKEFATQGISVLGEVVHPGIYPLLGSPRLLDAIAAAGGTTVRAGKTVIVTHREAPASSQIVTLDAKDTQQQNIALQRGDSVIVRRAGIVYVNGDVKSPGGFVMDNNERLTVLQAIALAQGLNPTASARNVRIIRRESGTLREVPVELRRIMEAKSDDIELKDEDVLFIPNSASKSAARRSLESIVQVATGLAIYRR